MREVTTGHSRGLDGAPAGRPCRRGFGGTVAPPGLPLLDLVRHQGLTPLAIHRRPSGAPEACTSRESATTPGHHPPPEGVPIRSGRPDRHAEKRALPWTITGPSRIRGVGGGP